MPVLEALLDESVTVDALFVARNARGDSLGEIVAVAARRGVRVQRVAPERVTRISGNGRHDQGVAAEVLAPGLLDLEDWLATAPGSFRLFLLDGITNPSNVGLIIRTAVAAGFDGVIVPRAGVADLGPLVVKASAGVVYRATSLRCESAAHAVGLLRSADARSVGLAGTASVSIYDVETTTRDVFVLGNETHGIAVEVDESASVPLRGGVESLNVATAAAVVAFELARRDRR